MRELIEKIKQKYNEIPVKYKKVLIIGFLVVSVVSIGTIKSSVDRQKKEEDKDHVVQDVPLTRNALEKSYYIKALEETEQKEQKIKELEASLSDLEKRLTSIDNKQQEDKKKWLQGLRDNKNRRLNVSENKAEQVVIPPPSLPKQSAMFNKPKTAELNRRINGIKGGRQQAQSQRRGGITIVSNPNKTTENKNEEDKNSLKKKNRILLPPSFMEATLLSGLDAPTSEGGKSHPVPMFFRVKAPAILPNEVKANLKGCFIIGEGTGRLDTERIDVRLVNISCVDVKGNGIIVSPLKGYIVDADSKIGLHGRVVTKMGSVLIRHMFAGLMGGAAEAAKNAGTTFSTTEFGMPVQNIDNSTSAALQSGLGSALSDSFKELQQFYLDLAKQMLPVIEVGALKEVTAVISKEVTLEIKEFE